MISSSLARRSRTSLTRLIGDWPKAFLNAAANADRLIPAINARLSTVNAEAGCSKIASNTPLNRVSAMAANQGNGEGSCAIFRRNASIRDCLSNASTKTRDPTPGWADSASSVTNWFCSPLVPSKHTTSGSHSPVKGIVPPASPMRISPHAVARPCSPLPTVITGTDSRNSVSCWRARGSICTGFEEPLSR